MGSNSRSVPVEDTTDSIGPRSMVTKRYAAAEFGR
jgi:hypothetical protein